MDIGAGIVLALKGEGVPHPVSVVQCKVRITYKVLSICGIAVMHATYCTAREYDTRHELSPELCERIAAHWRTKLLILLLVNL